MNLTRQKMDERREQKEGISSFKAQYGEDIFASQKQIYLIAKPWWDAWTAYVDNDQTKPGPIDNSSLVEDLSETPPVIKSDFNHNEAEFVSQSIWLRLLHWYGGGPAVELFVVEQVPDYTPVRIYVSKIESDLDIESQAFVVSKYITVKRLKHYLCQRMSIPYYKYEMTLSELDREKSMEGLDDYSLSQVDVEANSKVVLRKIEDKPKLVISDIEEIPRDQETDSASMASSEDSAEHRFVKIRADRAEVQEKLVQALQEATKRIRIRSLRKIQKSLMRQIEVYENWLRPS
mmetsp:Transcript_33479/g.58658  ORF Transcript_33479/g.58658 Transcript_33479/m.58658 type:complete len:290 (+) Transcript_33479:1780-2649(+)